MTETLDRFRKIKDMLFPMGLDDLRYTRNLVNEEIEARERQKLNRLLKEGWWVKEFGTADAALNDSQKCRILGIMHPRYNPHGEKRDLLMIKQLRDQHERSLTECKDLVDAYRWEVESWKTRPPGVECTILEGTESL